jgi:phospholipid/cholesterol/gamma-HCH transport system substrate-binding protein
MKKEIKIGVFAVVVLLATWAGVRFLSGLDVFSRTRTYYVNYAEVSGIAQASPVVIKGVKVGSVTNIKLDPTKTEGVTLTLEVSREYDLPIDSKAKLFSDGLMGGKAVAIEYGTASEFLKSGDHIIAAYDKGLMDIAGAELEGLTVKIGETLAKLTATLDGVNGILDDNRSNIKGVMTNLDSVTGTMSDVLTGKKQDLATAIDNLTAFADALGRNSAKIDSVVMNVNTIADQFATTNVAESLQQTIGKLNQTLDKLNNADGTVGKLMNDKVLYDNLAAASANLSTLLADLQAYPKRYVHFSLFGRGAKADEKGRQKAEQSAE